MTAVLTDKNSFEEFRIDPTIGMANSGTYIFQPYDVTITISGNIDPMYNIKRIDLIITSSADPDPWAYVNRLSTAVVDENGNFTLVENKFWTSPESIWFGGAYLYLSDY